MSTKWTYYDSWMLELGTCPNKSIIPSTHWSPAAYIQFVVTGCHGYDCSPISINVMSTIVINFPHLNNDPGPSPHTLSHIMNIKRMFYCGHSVIRLSFECLKFRTAGHVLPVLALNHLHLDVEWWLFGFGHINYWLYSATDVELWTFECRHI